MVIAVWDANKLNMMAKLVRRVRKTRNGFQDIKVFKRITTIRCFCIVLV